MQIRLECDVFGIGICFQKQMSVTDIVHRINNKQTKTNTNWY